MRFKGVAFHRLNHPSLAVVLATGACFIQTHAAEPLNLCDYEWKHVTASAAVSEPAGAWNPETGRFMVYGGYMNGWSPETWEFDRQKWVRLDASLPKQLVSRADEWSRRASMAYDERRRKMCLALVYPRTGDRQSDAELLEWENGEWVAKAKLPPDFRSLKDGQDQDVRIHLVFDHASQELFLLDGKPLGVNVEYPIDGWYYNGVSFRSAVMAPGVYVDFNQQVSSDPVRRKILTVAGYPTVESRVREWDGQVVTPGAAFPATPVSRFPGMVEPGRAVWGMASFYSPLHGGIVFAGGTRNLWAAGSDLYFQIVACNRTTAVWNGSGWSTLSINSPTLGGGIACFDTVLNRGLMYGGRSPFGRGQECQSALCLLSQARSGDVWALGNDDWEPLTVPPLGTFGRPHSTLLDPRTGRLICAGAILRAVESSDEGGSTNAFYHTEWNGQNWSRGPVDLGGVMPWSLANSDFWMAWDPAANRVVASVAMVRPASGPKVRTFAFDGAGWTALAGPDRTDWTIFKLVTNTAVQKVWAVVANKGIYQLNGDSWQEISTAIPPTTTNVFFDEVRERVVSLPDANDNGVPDATVEFNGTAWVATTSGPPFNQNGSYMNSFSYNPLIGAVTRLNYRCGRPVNSTADATFLGFPTNTEHRLAKWTGTAWEVIKNGDASPADGGYIWRDANIGKWFSFGGTPRGDIWELTPISGDRFVRQPKDAIGYANRSVSVSVQFRGGVGPVSYAWRVDGAPITTSPSVNANAVSGWTTPTITFSSLKTGTNSTLDCVITTGCETYTTEPIRLFATCRGDLNGDSMVDDADFVLFVGCYDHYYTPSDKPLCRLNDSNQVTDDQDFAVFVAAYDAGICP
jgi:hypothetical protein